jgi:hypothetical protein
LDRAIAVYEHAAFPVAATLRADLARHAGSTIIGNTTLTANTAGAGAAGDTRGAGLVQVQGEGRTDDGDAAHQGEGGRGGRSRSPDGQEPASRPLPHRGLPLSIGGGDVMNNSEMDIGRILRFLGRSEAVVTSTYHGMYWATLMGKRVVLAGAFSSKFFTARYPPTLYSGDLQADLAAAVRYPQALREAREANDAFAAELELWLAAHGG